jgi:hypothetical protein
MSWFKGLFVSMAMAGLAVSAAGLYAAEAAAPAKPVKVENPDIEMTVAIIPITPNPFSSEHPFVFHKGETIRLTVSLGNGEAEKAVPMKRGGKSWYDFLEFSIRITDANDRPVPVAQPLLVATLDKSEAIKGDVLPPESGTRVSWNLTIPESLAIKEDQVKITVECRLRAADLGLAIPAGSGKVFGSEVFFYKLKLTPLDEAVVRYRKAVALALGGEPKAALPDLEALAAQYPDPSMIAIMLGKVHEMAGDKAKAMAVYQQVIDKHRRDLPNMPNDRLRTQVEEEIAILNSMIVKLKKEGNAGGR